jgi:hypothetical protein
MAMDTSKFDAIKNKARKIIHEDAQKDSHIIKARQADRNNPAFFRDQPVDAYSQMTSLNGSSNSSMMNESAYVDDSEEKLGVAMDNRMKQFMENRQPTQQMQVSQAPKQINKNLPKEILESFSNNYIDQSALDPDRPVLDRIGITNGAQQITETYQPVQKPVGNVNVDYELIKSIVESAVKKYVNALGKKMLTENKDNDLAMIQIGDKKLNIVTKDGNLYEAKLEFKRNIKK